MEDRERFFEIMVCHLTMHFQIIYKINRKKNLKYLKSLKIKYVFKIVKIIFSEKLYTQVHLEL